MWQALFYFLLTMNTLRIMIAAFGILIYSAGCNAQGNVRIAEKDKKNDILIDDRLFSSYHTDPTLLKPCLHPVVSPSGEVVTRHYPFKNIEGESTDHPHHTGLYFTYGSKGEVNGNSFWNMHDAPPQIVHQKVVKMKGGKNKGFLSTVSHWIDAGNNVILTEHRDMDFHFYPDKTTIDFDIVLTATDTTITFEDTKEGMFAFRVADWLAEKPKGTLYEGTGEYMNAQGEKTEKNIWGKPSEWVRLQGEKDGKVYGVALFHHPESLNFPAFWHARGYGCFAANPIGQYDFQKGRTENPQKRTLVLQPGEKALFKFRVFVYEGEQEKQEFIEEFEEYSKL